MSSDVREVQRTLLSPSKRTQTLNSYLSTVVHHLYDHGNAYVEVVRDGNQKPSKLIIYPPDRIALKEKDGELEYYRKVEGERDPQLLPSKNVIHMRFEDNGDAISPSPSEELAELARVYNPLVEKTRRGISSARSFLHIQSSNFVSPDEKRSFLAAMKEAGIESAAETQTALVELEKSRQNAMRESMLAHDSDDVNAIFTSPNIEKLEWITPPAVEGAEDEVIYQRLLNQFAAVLGIPPVKVGIKASERFSNEKARFISFYSETLFGLLIAVEQAHELKMLSEEQRKAGSYIKFQPLDIIVGDLISLNLIAAGGIGQAITVNDLRELLRKPPLEEGGDELLSSAAPAGSGNRNESGEPLNPFAGEDEDSDDAPASDGE